MNLLRDASLTGLLMFLKDTGQQPSIKSTFIMADPLSIAASVTGLVTAGIMVTNSLAKFYNLYKHLDSSLIGTIHKLERLLDDFQSLNKTLSSRKFRVDEQSLVNNVETSIQRCDEIIQELKSECEKFDKALSSGIKAAVRTAGRRATYPFRQSTLQKLEEDIEEIRNHLFSALEILQLNDSQRIQDELDEMKLVLNLIRTDQISAHIRDWLKAPDVTINHNAACAKRHPRTGTWLLKDPTFTAWLAEENSFLWMNGFAGTGKSVLCSTAIQFVFRHRRSDPQIGIAFFYFTFSDVSKQDESAMLRTLLLQLSGQSSRGHSELTRLHHSYQNGIPPSSVLTDCLHRLIEEFHHVYIILDALDESPRNGARDQVLEVLEVMKKWSFRGLHLLVTSRDEIDIRDYLDPSLNQ